MSGSNVNVSMNDGLYYVHYDSINLYKNKHDPNDVRPAKLIPANLRQDYELDLPLSQANYDTWLTNFRAAMRKRYKSYRQIDKYQKAGKRIILQNDMFHVIIEDNEWSFAVELISRPRYPYPQLQKHLFTHFFKGMREILLTMTDTLYIRSGSWTAEPFTMNEQSVIDQHISASQIKINPKLRATCADNSPRKGENPDAPTA